MIKKRELKERIVRLEGIVDDLAKQIGNRTGTGTYGWDCNYDINPSGIMQNIELIEKHLGIEFKSEEQTCKKTPAQYVKAKKS